MNEVVDGLFKISEKADEYGLITNIIDEVDKSININRDLKYNLFNELWKVFLDSTNCGNDFEHISEMLTNYIKKYDQTEKS
ncbi:32141_t:CDS:2, partial [Gigaspora margarita]